MWERRRIGRFQGIVFTALWIHVVHGAELVINPAGVEQSQPAKKGFVLTCQGQGEDSNLFSDMKWINPAGETIEQNLPGQIEVLYNEDNLALIFKSPSIDDSGVYKCMALYANTDRLNSTVKITFYKDITWEDCPQKQSLVIEENGKIRCSVSANPSASISWTKDNKALTDNRYQIVTDGISVTNTAKEDEGIYIVRAMVTQTGKFQLRAITVEVHVPPQIVQLESVVEVIEGEEAALTCQATGSPQPSYTWLDPNKKDLSEVEGYFVGKDTGVLTIRSVKKEDAGAYTCEAKNDAGVSSKNLDLTVIVKPEIRKFDNITTVESKEAILECEATGEPLPGLKIRKDGHKEPFTEDEDHVHLSTRKESGVTILTMTIDRSVRSDDGLYYCSAVNEGAAVERVGHITVEFAPIMSSTPSTHMKTWNDNPVNLTCIAEAIPNATLTWFFNNIEIPQDSPLYVQYGKLSYSHLLVKPSRHLPGGENVYGQYRCDAQNAHGKKEVSIELAEARVPGLLLQTRVHKTTATTITFKIVGPKDSGGLPIRAFVVEYREKNEPIDANVQSEWSEDTPYILEGLKPRTAYRFKFAARNDVGIGEWSEEIEEVMPPESFPEPPKFITPGGNVSRYPDKFEIRWTLPQNNGKPIDYFQLRYFQVKRDGTDWEIIGDDHTEEIRNWQNSPRYEIVSLNPNSYYKVEVRAHNEIGFSQDATMVFRTAAGSTTDEQRVADRDAEFASLPMAAIIAIVVVLVIVILVAIDVTCFLRYQWGLLYFFRNSLCGKSAVGDKAKEAAAEDGKSGKELPDNNGEIKVEPNSTPYMDKGTEDGEEKSRTEVDNPAFDKEKEPLQSHTDEDRSQKFDMVKEDTPMIETAGAKDTKTDTNSVDAEIKNKSPKGSKSSIAKDSLV